MGKKKDFVPQTPAPQNNNKTLCTSDTRRSCRYLVIAYYFVFFCCICLCMYFKAKKPVTLCSVTVQQSHDNVGMMQLHGIWLPMILFHKYKCSSYYLMYVRWCVHTAAVAQHCLIFVLNASRNCWGMTVTQ